MTRTREIIQSALDRKLVDEDGNPVQLEILPPLTPKQVDEFASSLVCPPSDDYRDLLQFCSGIRGAIGGIDFTGESLASGFGGEDLLPHNLPIACDGFGNYWAVDLHPGEPSWGPIYFCCHDAPVMLLQADTVQQFVIEIIKMSTPPHKSLINDVHEDRLFNVWRKNPGVIGYADALNSSDLEIRAFAESLEPNFEIVDLRGAPIGLGLSWGRYGPRTEIRRFGRVPLFGYRKPKRTGLLSRISGR